MDQRTPLWSVFLYGVLMLSVVVAAIMVAWREHVGAQAMLRHIKAEDERWAADRQRQQRLAEIRDRLYLESLPEESRARELTVRARLAEHERQAREILAQDEAARGEGADVRT